MRYQLLSAAGEWREWVDDLHRDSEKFLSEDRAHALGQADSLAASALLDTLGAGRDALTERCEHVDKALAKTLARDGCDADAPSRSATKWPCVKDTRAKKQSRGQPGMWGTTRRFKDCHDLTLDLFDGDGALAVRVHCYGNREMQAMLAAALDAVREAFGIDTGEGDA